MVEEKPLSKKNIIWIETYKAFKNEVETLNSLVDHPKMLGDKNEETLMAFLKKFFPGRIKIEQCKKLLDRDGNASKEQDLVIWDWIKQPRIFSEKSDFFLIESVLATLEVKTILNVKTLRTALLNIQHLRKMNYFKRLDGDPRWQVHPPLCFIFAYDMEWKKQGILLQNIESIIKQNNIEPSERFDYLYIMKKGIIINWDVPHEPIPGLSRMDWKKKYGGIIPFNDRWPQFFPSKLIKEINIILSEMQIYQHLDINTKLFADLTIENQIKGMLNFLRTLCQALEDQKTFYSFNNISQSYSTDGKSLGGLVSKPY